MRWPPNQAWTSSKKRGGYRHFEIINYGGEGKERWVELFPVLDKEIRLRVSWSELNSDSEWKSGWLQLEADENCQGQQGV